MFLCLVDETSFELN